MKLTNQYKTGPPKDTALRNEIQHITRGLANIKRMIREY